MRILLLSAILGITGITTLHSQGQVTRIGSTNAWTSLALRRIADDRPAASREPFVGGRVQWRTNDVVALVGGANWVREQKSGEIELALTAGLQPAPRFRSMAWEGDTVFTQTRDMNWGTWRDQLDAVGASVAMLWFGQLEALEEGRTIAEFESAYARLMDEFRAITPRLIIVAPLPFEVPIVATIRDNTSRNAVVSQFAAVARRLAEQRGAVYLDWSAPGSRLTDNGMHLTPAGLRLAGVAMAQSLGSAGVRVDAPSEAHRMEIVRKNRLWAEAWRTMNWYFPFGDRTEQPFSKPGGGEPAMAEELGRFPPLLKEADDRIRLAASGVSLPDVDAPFRSPAPTRSPAEEEASFRLRPGFRVNLFAGESDGLVKPLQIRFDSRGRLWAACAPSYPQIRPGEAPSDYLLVCEDTDGDGRADRFERFATGLSMPMGMEFGDGGVYICESTQLVHWRDTDGDGRGDQQRVLVSGFGTGDTHQMINSLCWGRDGRLWMSQGLHIFSRAETPWGVSRLERAGIWQWNPRTEKLTGFLGGATAGANIWGMAWDDWGQMFHVAVDDLMAFYTLPALVPIPQIENYYRVGALAISKSKGMELEFIGTRHLPDELQGAFIKSIYYTGDVRAYRPVEDGSGYVTEDLGSLIRSDSQPFRPVESKVGPDGAIYICDWFNPIIGHYQASYRDPNRDKSHGRVWRLSHESRPLAQAKPLDKLSVRELLGQLGSGERWVREQARIQLYGKAGGEVRNAMVEESRRLGGFSQLPPALLSQWISTAAGFEERPADLLGAGLSSPDPRVRSLAVRMTAVWSGDQREILAQLKAAAEDSVAQVRLEALVASASIPLAESITVATRVTRHPRDRFIDYAFRQVVRALKPQWEPALASSRLAFSELGDSLAEVLAVEPGPASMALIRRALAVPGGSSRSALLQALARVGDAADVSFALEQSPADPAVWNHVTDAFRSRKIRPQTDPDRHLKSAFASKDSSLQIAAVQAAAAWRWEGLRPLLRQKLELADRDPQVAAAGWRALGAVALAQDSEFFRRGVESPSVPEKVAAWSGWMTADLAGALTTLSEKTDVWKEPATASAVLTELSRHANGVEQLAGLWLKKVPDASAREATRQWMARTGWVSTAMAAVVQPSQQEFPLPGVGDTAGFARWAEDTRREGDARRGAMIFRRADVACASCHRAQGEGGRIGPDLGGIGAGQPLPFIIESVLYPASAVKEGFHAVSITTRDDEEIRGILRRDWGNELQIREITDDREMRVEKSRIRERRELGTIMPEGLLSGLSRGEILDLFRFLEQLGREPR